jgi:threonine dehydratase
LKPRRSDSTISRIASSRVTHRRNVTPQQQASFAALLYNKVNVPAGSTVVCVLSGGNVDREKLKAIL